MSSDFKVSRGAQNSPKNRDVINYDKVVHIVILEYFSIKEYALSNFAFQSFYIFIGTQDKNNFSIPVRDS